MAERFPNSGAVFPRQKRNEKAADMGGDVTIEEDVLDYIVRAAENGSTQVKLELSAWKRRTRDGGSMLSMKVEIPYEIRKNGGQPSGGQRQGGYDRGDERPPIRTSNGPYRGGGRDNGGRDYQPRTDYGRPSPRHDTEIGGSGRDRPRREERPQRDFDYNDRPRDPLDDL
jgi:hypothetical protein